MGFGLFAAATGGGGGAPLGFGLLAYNDDRSFDVIRDCSITTHGNLIKQSILTLPPALGWVDGERVLC